jgi:hypothetical protein
MRKLRQPAPQPADIEIDKIEREAVDQQHQQERRDKANRRYRYPGPRRIRIKDTGVTGPHFWFLRAPTAMPASSIGL